MVEHQLVFYLAKSCLRVSPDGQIERSVNKVVVQRPKPSDHYLQTTTNRSSLETQRDPASIMVSGRIKFLVTKLYTPPGILGIKVI